MRKLSVICESFEKGFQTCMVFKNAADKNQYIKNICGNENYKKCRHARLMYRFYKKKEAQENERNKEKKAAKSRNAACTGKVGRHEEKAQKA
jgi:hypothetical protein